MTSPADPPPYHWSFTPRERQILARLPGGATYQAIARQLGISTHTVDTYMRRLRSKTGSTNRTQLAVLAVQLEYHSASSGPTGTDGHCSPSVQRPPAPLS
jgi:DNA-binding CsgD family transcriptional regulator